MKIPELGKSLIRSVYSNLPVSEISQPVFIIGCGRSGTTIFGTVVSQHHQITYLNEPRHLWTLAYPETDIWSPSSTNRNGKMCMTATDSSSGQSKKLRRLFHLETIINRSPVLVEKLPINNFRLSFINAIFPDAKFIHIYRNGLEVAKSIEKISAGGAWFGANSYKWERLKDYVIHHEQNLELLNLCSTFYEKGLLEWRLSTEAAVQFLQSLPEDKYFELSYGQLLEQPIEVMAKVLEFLELEQDPDIDRFIDRTLSRRTQNLSHISLSDKEKVIGGKFLPLSMLSDRSKLTSDT